MLSDHLFLDATEKALRDDGVTMSDASGCVDVKHPDYCLTELRRPYEEKTPKAMRTLENGSDDATSCFGFA